MVEDFDFSPFGVNKTKRLTVSSAESKLFIPHSFPNGFVRLVDYLGGDQAIYHAMTSGVGSDLVGGMSPPDLFDTARSMGAYNGFKFAEMKVHAMMPIQSALYWMYVEELSGNEYSGRYSVMLDSGRILEKKEIEVLLAGRLAELKTKGKKSQLVDRAESVFAAAQKNARGLYETFLSADLARELARIGLGLGTHTMFYLSGNFEQWMSSISRAKALGSKHPFMKHLHAEAEQFESLLAAICPEAVNSYNRFVNGSLKPKNIDLKFEALEKSPSKDPRYGRSDTKRLTVESAEDLLWAPESYLDNGWFMPTDYMGSDESVVQSARTSYGRGTTKVNEDRILLRFLRRHRHTTPFHAVEVQAEQKTPLFVWPRQGGRHRTMDKEGVLNCFVPLNDFYHIPDEEIRKQSTANRQGRGAALDDSRQRLIRHGLEFGLEAERLSCEALEDIGVPLEAVFALKGVGHYTRGTVKVDLHNGLHFLGLRNDPHAQREIQLNAAQWERFIAAVAPESVAAFGEYERGAMRFSVNELKLVSRALAEGKSDIPVEWYAQAGWTKKDPETGDVVPNREADELNVKMKLLAFLKPTEVKKT